ncbi:MAG: histidine kinase [Flavobacterium sp.]
MKYFLSILLISVLGETVVQSVLTENSIRDFEGCKNVECQLAKSFLVAENFLDDDNLVDAQKWLDITKNLNSYRKIDTTAIFINSLQSELFYYNGLYQFGVTEAEKVIKNSLELKDSLLISNGYFFKGINLFESNKPEESQKLLWKSRDFQPKNLKKKYLRYTILNEHIYNNLAQTKLRLNELDSAIWYNSEAYNFAKRSNSKRGIPNIEQTYGQIYLESKKLDEAINYFKKSIISAKVNNYDDIVLGSYGYLLQCYPKQSKEIEVWFKKGLDLIEDKKINISYQNLFFKTSIKAFAANQQLEKLTFAQEKLIDVNEKIALSSNDYIQNITKQYIANENKLLKQELNLAKSQKEKQVFYLVISALIAISVILFFYFKQRHKLKNKEIKNLKQDREISNLEALIDGEEKERKRVAQELHDGLNGDLSAIKYRLSSLEDAPMNAENRENLSQTISMIDSACSQVRSISHNLIPTSILDFGLVETLNEYCEKINFSLPLNIELQHFGNSNVLDKKTETVIYRIIQELINNITKHSKATTALVQLNFHDSELFITVEDNGIGFKVHEEKTGLGLKNIYSRVDFLNANLEIDSSDKGSSYHISIDLNSLKDDSNSHYR